MTGLLLGSFEGCNTVPKLSFFLRHEFFLLMLGALAKTYAISGI
jgi:hypothetical protein